MNITAIKYLRDSKKNKMSFIKKNQHVSHSTIISGKRGKELKTGFIKALLF